MAYVHFLSQFSIIREHTHNTHLRRKSIPMLFSCFLFVLSVLASPGHYQSLFFGHVLDPRSLSRHPVCKTRSTQLIYMPKHSYTQHVFTISSIFTFWNPVTTLEKCSHPHISHTVLLHIQCV
eukprot:c3685_g1_i1 orf=3-365(-)